MTHRVHGISHHVHGKSPGERHVITIRSHVISINLPLVQGKSDLTIDAKSNTSPRQPRDSGKSQSFTAGFLINDASRNCMRG